MKPIKFSIFGQAGQAVITPLKDGWNRLTPIKAGIWLRRDALEFWNACPGAGELFISRIEIMFDGAVSGVLARANWMIDPVRPNVLIIGTGHEYVAPRDVLTVRWNYRQGETAPTQIPYGPTTVTWAASQKRDLFTSMAARLTSPRDTGMWAPGVASPHRQADPPGADERNGVSGWEQDVPGMLLRSDLVMERMAVGCLDQQTGQPIMLPNEHDYTLDRGWTKLGQLQAFCQPVTSIYDTVRHPIVTWPGTCGYRDTMLGANIYNSFTPFNGQHCGNALGHVRAAAQCVDESAAFFLNVLANDAAMAKDDASANPRGGRDMAWRMDAWAHSRVHYSRGQAAADEVERAQMPNGGILRGSKDYGFNPTPQSFGMPADWDSDQLMERDLTIYSWGLFNKLAAIKKAILGRPQPSTVKFVGVGQTGGEAFPTYQHPCGSPDYYPMLGLGVWATLEPRNTQWQTLAVNQPTPEGVVCHTLLALRNQLRKESRGCEQTAMILAKLEQMNLG